MLIITLIISLSAMEKLLDVIVPSPNLLVIKPFLMTRFVQFKTDDEWGVIDNLDVLFKIQYSLFIYVQFSYTPFNIISCVFDTVDVFKSSTTFIGFKIPTFCMRLFFLPLVISYIRKFLRYNSVPIAPVFV